MTFLNNAPDWQAPSTKVVEPDSTRKQAGWQVGEKPPAYVFNWFWNHVSDALQIFDTHQHDARYYTKAQLTNGSLASHIDSLQLTNNERTDLTKNGQLIYDQSDGLYLNYNYSGAPGGPGVAKILDTKNSNLLRKSGGTLSGTLTLDQGALLKKTDAAGETDIIIDDNGRVWNSVYNDIAEMYPAEKGLEANQVLIWDGEKLTTTTKPEDDRVIGVYSDTFGYCLGGQPGAYEDLKPIGISGKVRVKVKGKVNSMDLLTTSEIPGVAQASKNKELGTIFAKALEEVKEGETKIIWAFISMI